MTETPQAETRPSFSARLAALAPVTDETPIVPHGNVVGRSLIVVIAAMCFLACVAAGIFHMVAASATAWTSDIAREATVRLRPLEGADMDARVTAVRELLAATPGIATVRVLSADQSAELLEPWLGASEALRALPIPRLIALQIDQKSPPDFDLLARELAKRDAGATLDDHRRWSTQIRTVTRSLKLAAGAILALIAATTVAIIFSATHSAMSGNRAIVEVLHLVGANERFIAREFQNHFLMLGVKGGLIGAGAGAAAFLAMPYIVRVLAGQTLARTDISALFGGAFLEPAGYLWFLAVIAAAALICMATSRLSVFRVLRGHV